MKKEAIRVPLLEKFSEYASYGRQLAQLHLNYDKLNTDCVTVEVSKPELEAHKLFRVEKMRFSKSNDKSTLIFNPYITLRNIPLECYSYLVNGKSPIDWVVDRYRISEDSDSGILNDPNEFSDDPIYVLNLLLSVITMTKKILELQKTLPKLVIPEE